MALLDLEDDDQDDEDDAELAVWLAKSLAAPDSATRTRRSSRPASLLGRTCWASGGAS